MVGNLIATVIALFYATILWVRFPGLEGFLYGVCFSFPLIFIWFPVESGRAEERWTTSVSSPPGLTKFMGWVLLIVEGITIAIGIQHNML